EPSKRGTRSAALGSNACRAVERGVDLLEELAQLAAGVLFRAVPVAPLRAERPRSSVEPMRLRISSSPPHSAHVTGQRLVHLRNAHLAADTLLDDLAYLRSERHDRLK